MSSYQTAIKEALRAAIADSFSLDTDAIALSDPPPDTQGEVASNIAFVLARQLKQNPRAIAETLASALASHAIIAHASAAGNGFINMTCTHEFWQHQLHDMIHHATWRAITIGRGSKVNVEYVSANPTGLLHIGHLRGAITGDVLANVLAFTGHEVTREYYLNDAGGQIDVLLQSIRWHQQQKQQEPPKDLYNSDEVKQFAQKHDIDDDEELKQKAVRAMLSLICDELTLVGITHDVFFSEREMIASGAVNDSLARLHQSTVKDGKEAVYEGILARPKGRESADWHSRPQLLFRSTSYGDDQDRAIVKEDGSPTYFASDIAYHEDKIARGYNQLINVWGSDHSGYVKRLQGALATLHGRTDILTVILVAMVRLKKGDELLVLSKREGTTMSIGELTQAVGKDAVRFLMLTRRSDAPLDFDIALARKAVRDNPVFYVHYAHARCASVLRLAAAGEKSHMRQMKTADFSSLTSSAELALMRQLARFYDTVLGVVHHREPHRLVYYVTALAEHFHRLWYKGREDETMRLLDDTNPNRLRARLALVTLTKDILAQCLELLGIEPRDELRSDQGDDHG